MAYLQEPITTKRLTLKNRLVMPPMATSKCNEDGTMSNGLLEYYDEKSRGGNIGLIITEHCYISEEGMVRKKQLSVSSDQMIDGLKRLADTIHKNGSKTVLQINHAGSAAKKKVTGLNVVGPTTEYAPGNMEEIVTSELSTDDIHQITLKFRDAALRAKESGFDGVEIHSAHGYLLNQFYSPLSNKRNDTYGGDLEGRIRFHLEVIKAVREAVGNDYPILLRLGAADYMDGGSDIEDAKAAAIAFEKAGVDILDISGGFCGYVRPGVSEEGYFSPLTEEIKKVVSIPVILTGGIIHAETADKLLIEGKADLIGVGRAIYMDSDWAQNAMLALKK
ncbi:MAG: NADH:flavin oxidoreductase [Clostridiaceae bacterium]